MRARFEFRETARPAEIVQSLRDLRYRGSSGVLLKIKRLDNIGRFAELRHKADDFKRLALLFVGGVMNLLWIAGLMAFVLIEKLAPGARWISRWAGIAAIAAGLWLLR